MHHYLSLNLGCLTVFPTKAWARFFARKVNSTPTPAAIPTPTTKEGKWRTESFFFCIMSHCKLTSSACHKLKCTASIIFTSESSGEEIASVHTGQQTCIESRTLTTETLPATAIALSRNDIRTGWGICTVVYYVRMVHNISNVRAKKLLSWMALFLPPYLVQISL